MAWTHLKDTAPKARKRYQCYLCYDPIEVGEVHVHRTGTNDGLMSFRMHVDCEKQTDDWDCMDWETFDPGSMDRETGGEK
jgi:hypothetical protein